MPEWRPSRQWNCAICAASSALAPVRDRRPAAGAVEERQLVRPPAEDGHAERLERLGGGGTSRIDLAPEQTTSASVRASSPRSAETSSVSAKPRWTPPIPPVPMNPIPAARQTASVAPTVVAPSSPFIAQAARSAGRPCAPRGRGEALELALLEPDADAPVDDSDGGGHGPSDSYPRLGLGGDLGADAVGEAVGDQGRLEGDDRPAGFERGTHLRVDPQELGH